MTLENKKRNPDEIKIVYDLNLDMDDDDDLDRDVPENVVYDKGSWF